jgi:hypothetical protein
MKRDVSTSRRSLALLTLAVMAALLVLPPDAAGQPTDRRDDPAPRMSILVPAYFYPSGPGRDEWQRMLEAARKAPIVIIANPASGPGRRANPLYQDMIRRAVEAKITVIGYVSTSYARRTIDEIREDCRRWMEFYPEISGFFLDEQTSDAEHVENYRAYIAEAKAANPSARIFTNPGTTCDQGYLSRAGVDVVCIFEGPKALRGDERPAWATRYEPQRFAALPYAQKGKEAPGREVAQALKMGIGHIYTTDDEGRNPWDRLPREWDALVDAVAVANRR